ncbi:MAG: lysophospholipid acyltransferase family protein [Rhodobacteraceae bacterium]|jgi:putative hemolysin|nr:lysophospholipid acyltransferase family protein [Paracoccaceae bacterium]
MQSELARDISYASAARGPTGRAVIRLLENATGRLSLIRRATGYERDLRDGRAFWDVIPARYGLSLDVTVGSLASIPRDGPLVLIANHPYGILDGLMMAQILHRTRPDFRILANAVFIRAAPLTQVILPIAFDETPAALQMNLTTRAKALAYLGQGGAIGVFPGGTVSTAARPFSQPLDPVWRSFTAKMISRSRATVVPIYFEGHNSRLFQIASHLHYTLRLGLLLREFRARIDAPVKLRVGLPIAPEHLPRDPARMMETLRAATYALSPAPVKSYDLGYEFEARYR